MLLRVRAQVKPLRAVRFASLSCLLGQRVRVLPPWPPIQPIKLTNYRINPLTGRWIWSGPCDRHGYAIDGYGRFIDHQVYREHNGEIPDGIGIM